MKNQIVSVIIPCTDRVEGLDRCIMSALAQDCEAIIEVILIENNSNDRSKIPLLIESINDERIKHYYLELCENANWARNYGVEVSSGGFIAYLDSDDWWGEFHIRNNLELMSNGAQALYSSYTIDNGKYRQAKESYAIGQMSPYEFLFGKNCGVAQTSSFFLDKKVFDIVKWDEDLKRSQDYDFFIRVQKHIGWTYNHNSDVYVYWQEGMARAISVPAFEMFLNKHESMMTENERAQYLSEISKALVETSKKDFLIFRKRLSPYFSCLALKDKLILMNYFSASLYCNFRVQYRRLKAKLRVS
ncbi:glycosyltransferase family 2 protein [Vibrio sp. TRT 21S02]|uniref:glycosyltransferase family 2 protein n=1 Tax=Vibrio sp. TRT 21S02 TaxID=3418507 RepID=UPI003CF3E543